MDYACRYGTEACLCEAEIYGSIVQRLEPPAHNGFDLKEVFADRQGVKQSKDIIFSNIRVNSSMVRAHRS